jgi:adenine-specific DNA glycosylase
VILPEKRHIFTHLEWRMTPVRAAVSAESPGFAWASPEEMQTRYPLPRAFAKCLEG